MGMRADQCDLVPSISQLFHQMSKGFGRAIDIWRVSICYEFNMHREELPSLSKNN